MPAEPTVSIILPTYGRPDFVRNALTMISRQRYPQHLLQVVVVDDSPSHMVAHDLVGGHATSALDVLYLLLAGRRSLGEKRNIAVNHSLGAVVVNWDDDDFYHADRVAEQVAPIASGDADITLLEFQAAYWLADDELIVSGRHRAQGPMASGGSWGPHFGTLAYRRNVWGASARYPECSISDDVGFAQLAVQLRGARVRMLPSLRPGKLQTGGESLLYTYVRHGSNHGSNPLLESDVDSRAALVATGTRLPAWLLLDAAHLEFARAVRRDGVLRRLKAHLEHAGRAAPIPPPPGLLVKGFFASLFAQHPDNDTHGLVHTLRSGSEVARERAAFALAAFAKAPTYRAAIPKAGGVIALLDLLRSGTSGQKERAAGALANLAEGDAGNKRAIAAEGGLPLLVALAEGGTGRQKELAAAALLHLAEDGHNQKAIAAEGGLRPLLAMLRGASSGQRLAAAGVVRRLAVDRANRVAIAAEGGLPDLIALTRNGTSGQREQAVSALLNLAADADNQIAIVAGGGLPPLVELLRSGTDVHKVKAAGVLRNLASNEANLPAIAAEGALTLLLASVRYGGERLQDAAAGALHNLALDASYRADASYRKAIGATLATWPAHEALAVLRRLRPDPG